MDIDETKRLTTKEDVCKKYLNDNKIDWDALPQNVKDVLVDLTYRGDYTGTKDKRGNTREVIVPAIYKDQLDDLKGDNSRLYSIMKKEDFWRSTFRVDRNRHIKRMEHLK